MTHGEEDDHPNAERWLVSYADFITLMFAFFVVMFASSQADKQKIASVSNAVTRALEQGSLSVRSRSPVQEQGLRNLKQDASPPKERMSELAPSLKRLTSDLAHEIATGKVQIALSPRGLIVSLREAAFFPTGDATVAVEGYSTIEKVANTIRKLPNPVRLEGHTDSIPIHNSRFASNWELSAARSIAMLGLLTQRFEIPASKLAVVGYGETIATDTNDTAEGRARNRRVDITILNEASVTQEPHADDLK